MGERFTELPTRIDSRIEKDEESELIMLMENRQSCAISLIPMGFRVCVRVEQGSKMVSKLSFDQFETSKIVERFHTKDFLRSSWRLVITCSRVLVRVQHARRPFTRTHTHTQISKWIVKIERLNLSGGNAARIKQSVASD